MANILAIENLTVSFHALKAVSALNLTIEGETIRGLIGPNGAGKTTVFNTVSGFLRPSEGNINFLGRPIARLNPHEITALGVARTFQNIKLFGDLSVVENVLIGFHTSFRASIFSAIFRLPSTRREERQIHEKTLALLEKTGLAECVNKKAASLPYGLQRRLEIARALAARPKLLLLDEPAAGMNPSEKEDLMRFIREIRDSLDLTILLIEHDMRVVMGICDKITVLEYGRKIAEGTPTEIQNNDVVIEAYLGEESQDL
ncbi:MAG: ABC transporter ATP-binding protein [Deltaproteobacteria bacterium]